MGYAKEYGGRKPLLLNKLYIENKMQQDTLFSRCGMSQETEWERAAKLTAAK